MTRQEEAAAIAKVLEGDPNAFEPLVLANQSSVYSLALKTLSNPEDAFDVAQEVFVRAFRSLKSFKGESSFSSWLYRITANMCIDFIRKNKKRYNMVSIDSAEDDSAALDLPDIRYSPETELEKKELHSAIDEALSALAPEQRSILLLRELGDMSYAEISECLGLDTGTVKSRVFRARAKLLKVLQTRGNFFEK